MRAVLLLLVLAAAVTGAAYGLAAIPGTLAVSIGDLHVDAPMSVAVTLLLVFVLLLFLVFRLFELMVRLPRRTGLRGELRRRREGDRALTASLLALAAGENADARREASRARRLLGRTPQTLLATAEAEHAAGRRAEAEANFQALADRKDSAFLGLRGLVRLALETGNWTRARVLLDRAEKVRPDAAWLRRERLALAARMGAWAEAAALATTDAERAAFTTAAADAETDRGRALKLARQAHKLAPDLAPAALAYARRLREDWSETKAAAVLRETWRRAPNPLLADAVLAREPDPLKRVKLAETFVARGTDPLETHLLLGRAALDAGMIGEARRHAEAARTLGGVPDRRVLLLAGEIAERDTSLPEPDRRAAFADALRRAASAPLGPAWRCTACGTEHGAWAPVCTHCGTAGRIAWTKVVPPAAPDVLPEAPLLLGGPAARA